MFLKMAGRRVVVMGGEEEAAQKTRLMLKTEAEIVIAAPTLSPELEELARAGRVIHCATPFDATLFENAILAFAATGCPGADAAQAAVAQAHGVLVNAVDQPDICEAYTPAIVDRDPVVVAIGTEGTAPVLARRIKTALETQLEPNLGRFAAAMGRMRGMVAQRVKKAERRAFWAWVWDGLRAQHARGEEDQALSRFTQAALEGRAPDAQKSGSVALVGAGPGGPDLITLRGMRRLQEADVILYDRLADPEILELARRDAERIDVGKIPGDAVRPASWQQDRIARLMVQHAREGQRVVRLKCGDPGVFARTREELDACTSAGLPVEIVPGVTAASAAAAEFNDVLTERERIDAFTVATARDVLGNAQTAATALRPGENVALYMGVGKVTELQEALLTQCPSDLPVTIVQRTGYPDARKVTGTLGSLAETVSREGVTHPSVIFIRWPKDHAVARAVAV
jgi:uroporphyrin-III C-methyltransferase/precorrin-2 dehydrogenase/sirohydrochlorin ferrochelatase